MRRVLTIVALLLATNLYAFPRTWSVQPQSTGYVIASNTAQLLTATFNPRNLVVCNNAAAGGQPIYVNFTGVTAAAMTVALATTMRIEPQECYNNTFQDSNVSNTFTLAIMTAAATADYRVIGTRP
jgi:hypothetical protein